MTGMDKVNQLERDCADAWPALVDEPLGQWRLRAAGGFTGRANSALTLGDPGVPLALALARTVGFARANDIRPIALVVTATDLENDLAAADWVVETGHPGGAESVVLTGPLTECTRTGPGVAVLSEPPPDWWPLAVAADRPTLAQYRVLAGRAGLGFGVARQDGQVTGIVRGAVVGDLLHIARLAVAPTHRRQGLATALLAALADWARQRGATRCALQVAAHNEAALSLYAGLRCRPHHRYRYWTPAR
jgi:ribosomal protein S18 acetylase RimI-like enzyme